MFLDFVRSLIPSDKFRNFCALFKYPVKTVELTEQIYQALYRVFDGQDSVFQYEFTGEGLEQDWSKYQKEQLKEPEVWQSKGFAAMKSMINSVVVVDIPQGVTQSRPDPYFYFLDIGSVIDFEADQEGAFQWVMFKQDAGRIAVFDDERYRVFQTREEKYQEIIEVPEVDTPHTLAYCPAKWFWTDAATIKEPELKKSPVSNQLGDLDWLLFFSIGKRHLDTYANYPIYSVFEEDCDYADETAGHYCNNGYLQNRDGVYLMGYDNALRECPVCGNSKLAGAGTLVTIPPPGPENDKADLRHPVQITTIDRPSLDYNVEEEERLKRTIYQSVTGYGGEPVNDQAVNEKQVIASFESRKAVLMHLKKNFEEIHKWTDETICKIRYGASFVGASINYGREFYLYTPEMLLNMYAEAKAKGLDSSVLDHLQNQYYQTKYRHNPRQLQRQRIIINLDPFRHLDKGTITAMRMNGEIEFPDYYLKANFSTLITRFERENTSLLEFGENLEFRAKIDRIRESLLAYVPEPQTAP